MMAFLAANPTARPATRASAATSAVVIASSSSETKSRAGGLFGHLLGDAYGERDERLTYKGLLAASLVPPRTSRQDSSQTVSCAELVFVRISLSNSQCTAERAFVQYPGARKGAGVRAPARPRLPA